MGLKKQLHNLHNLVKDASQPEKAFYDPMSLGYANGLIVAEAVLRGEAPRMLEVPSEFGMTKDPKFQQIIEEVDDKDLSKTQKRLKANHIKA